MVDKITPIVRPQTFTDTGKGKREDAPTKKNTQQKTNNHADSTINILFPDVMCVALEEQVSVTPLMMQSFAAVSYKEAAIVYKTVGLVIKDPSATKHHLHNILT